MALTITILQDGPINTRIRVVSEGQTVALPYTVIANPTTLSFMDQSFGLRATALRIDKVDYDVEDGLEVDVFWGNTTPANADPIWAFTGRGMVDNCKYKDFNNSKISGWDGTIAISTTTPGGTPLADSFTLVFTLVKQRVPNTN
jgi:hypothetical protein